MVIREVGRTAVRSRTAEVHFPPQRATDFEGNTYGERRCHSVAIAGVFCGSFCPFVSPAPRSVTAREVREVAEKVVVAPTGFEPVFAVRHALFLIRSASSAALSQHRGPQDSNSARILVPSPVSSRARNRLSLMSRDSSETFFGKTGTRTRSGIIPTSEHREVDVRRGRPHFERRLARHAENQEM